MKISIITPIYNAAETLEKTITSVLGQEMDSELEYIIIDGGSTDGSQEIVNRYLDRISVFISERDEGLYDAMNKGVSCATGDIIGIINADDWYNDGSLKLVEQVFMKNEDVSIVYSPTDNYLDGHYLNTFIPGDLDNLRFKFTINHPTCFIRDSVYKSLGLYDLSYSISADYDFILRAYVGKYKFYYISRSLASYSLNGMSGKPSNKFKQMRQNWEVSSKIVRQSSKDMIVKHRNFYLYWFGKELLFFPLKQIIKPPVVKKIKSFLRKRFGSLPSDRYGAW